MEISCSSGASLTYRTTWSRCSSSRSIPFRTALDVVHSEQVGRIQTLIVRGNQDTVQELLAQCHPMLCDLLPLSLEEIFIYELGGVDYDVKNIVL